MSELPELPPHPHRLRPVPPGGLDRVVQDGRRRRVRFLGGTAAGSSVAVAVVLALLSTPDSRSDSLQIATSPPRPPSTGPTAASTADPMPDATASPTTAAGDQGAASAQPAPAPAGTAAAEPQAGPSGPAPDGSPAALPAAPPAKPGAAAPAAEPDRPKPAFREQTDEDAPGNAFCTPTKAVQAGAGACAYSGDSGSVLRRGDTATVALGECAGGGNVDSIYAYAGGQETELVVTRDGQVVYRFSDTVRYVQGPHERRLRAGRCIEWKQTWNGTSTDGRPVPAGTYRLELTMTSTAEYAEFDTGREQTSKDRTTTHALQVRLID